MYSVKASILELAALCCAHGITDMVLCAGSRSAPLVHTFASCPEFHCTPMVDERSAAFTALGISAWTKRPCAICCTSGSALMDMAPAAVEAYYRHLPLLFISADRPASWIGQMDGQTMVQPGAFRNFIRREVSLPEPHDAESHWYCNRLINEALLDLTHGDGGPVHINVPVTEPLFDMSAASLPGVRVIRREPCTPARFSDDMRKEWQDVRRPVIIVGQELHDNGLAGILEKLMDRGFLVLAEHLANVGTLQGRAGFSDAFDLVLTAPDSDIPEVMKPDCVITLGGHIVSKRLKKFLRVVHPCMHWHISRDGSCPDLFQSLTRVVEAGDRDFLELLQEEPVMCDPAFRAAWDTRTRSVRSAAAASTAGLPFSDAAVMGRFLARLPENSALALGNSSPVRNAQYFSLPSSVAVTCNRGVNGIDGCLSEAAGYAQASGRLTFAPIGDLSFFYDRNALWREDLPAGLRILLFNNGGGGIFHVLPGLEKSEHRDRFIGGMSHRNAEVEAVSSGMRYLHATDFEELSAALAVFCSPEPQSQPMLLEVTTDLETSASATRTIARAAAEASGSVER